MTQNTSGSRRSVQALNRDRFIPGAVRHRQVKLPEQKRDKTKLIKQGMMQELLTGKTRLV